MRLITNDLNKKVSACEAKKPDCPKADCPACPNTQPTEADSVETEEIQEEIESEPVWSSLTNEVEPSTTPIKFKQMLRDIAKRLQLSDQERKLAIADINYDVALRSQIEELMTRVVYCSNENRQRLSGNDLRSSLSHEQRTLVALAVKRFDNKECSEAEKR